MVLIILVKRQKCVQILFSFKIFQKCIFTEKGREGERAGEKHQCVRETFISGLPYTSQLGTKPATQAHALTRNLTSDPAHWATPVRACVRIFYLLVGWEIPRSGRLGKAKSVVLPVTATCWLSKSEVRKVWTFFKKITWTGRLKLRIKRRQVGRGSTAIHEMNLIVVGHLHR